MGLRSRDSCGKHRRCLVEIPENIGVLSLSEGALRSGWDRRNTGLEASNAAGLRKFFPVLHLAVALGSGLISWNPEPEHVFPVD